MKKYYALILGFSIIIVVSCGKQKPGADGSETNLADEKAAIDTTEIVAIPKEWDKNSLTFSDDGNNYAFVLHTTEGECVIHNGKKGRTFTKCGSIEFAPETAEVFYWALMKDQAREQIILMAGETPIPTEYVSEGWLYFSENGKRWLTIGGTKSTREGNTIKTGQVIIISDGQELSRHSDASIPTFSNDGKHIAYLAKGESSAVSLYVDGKEVRTYKEPEVKCSFTVTAYEIGPNMHNHFFAKYLSDGRLLILSQNTDGWNIYKDTEPLAVYLQNIWGGGSLRVMHFSEFKTTRSIVPWSVVVAENSPFSLWWERMPGEKEQWRVVRDGIPVDTIICTDFWNSQRPVISANGLHWAYAATIVTPPSTNEEYYAVIDGKKFGPYGNVWGLTLSEDGSRSAYTASDSSGDKWTWSYFLDGKHVPLKYDKARAPIISQDGNHITWRATRDMKAVIALDCIEIAQESDLLWGPYFAGSKKLVWVGAEQDRLIRKSISMPRKKSWF